MPRKAQNVPANEKSDARFKRVATSRVNSLLQGFKQLGSLGNPKTYESKPEQRNQIKEALTKGLERALDTLNKGGETPQDFKL
jgi:hypothetical protein